MLSFFPLKRQRTAAQEELPGAYGRGRGAVTFTLISISGSHAAENAASPKEFATKSHERRAAFARRPYEDGGNARTLAPATSARALLPIIQTSSAPLATSSAPQKTFGCGFS